MHNGRGGAVRKVCVNAAWAGEASKVMKEATPGATSVDKGILWENAGNSVRTQYDEYECLTIIS